MELNPRLYLIWKLQGYCTPHHQVGRRVGAVGCGVGAVVAVAVVVATVVVAMEMVVMRIMS